jgi:predicted O-methyltransferase YrrM
MPMSETTNKAECPAYLRLGLFDEKIVADELPQMAVLLHWRNRLAFIEGWLGDAEGYALLLLAAHGPGDGQIVEIGSYQGLSTAWLAAGSRSAGREKVTAVDHFQGSKEHQQGKPYESPVLLREGSTYSRFRANLRRAGLDDQVRPLVAASVDAARDWQQPIRLLFIDGGHSYESSRCDFELWSRFVIPGGIICFHDINHWAGVTRFYRELMASSGLFQELTAIQSLRIIQRKSVEAPA